MGATRTFANLALCIMFPLTTGLTQHEITDKTNIAVIQFCDCLVSSTPVYNYRGGWEVGSKPSCEDKVGSMLHSNCILHSQNWGFCGQNVEENNYEALGEHCGKPDACKAKGGPCANTLFKGNPMDPVGAGFVYPSFCECLMEESGKKQEQECRNKADSIFYTCVDKYAHITQCQEQQRALVAHCGGPQTCTVEDGPCVKAIYDIRSRTTGRVKGLSTADDLNWIFDRLAKRLNETRLEKMARNDSIASFLNLTATFCQCENPKDAKKAGDCKSELDAKGKACIEGKFGKTEDGDHRCGMQFLTVFVKWCGTKVSCAEQKCVKAKKKIDKESQNALALAIAQKEKASPKVSRPLLEKPHH